MNFDASSERSFPVRLDDLAQFRFRRLRTGLLVSPPYLRALRPPFPHVSFIAAGGVNQQTAGEYIHAGAVALGIGADLIPPRAIDAREQAWIVELARRFSHLVKNARKELAINH